MTTQERQREWARKARQDPEKRKRMQEACRKWRQQHARRTAWLKFTRTCAANREYA